MRLVCETWVGGGEVKGSSPCPALRSVCVSVSEGVGGTDLIPCIPKCFTALFTVQTYVCQQTAGTVHVCRCGEHKYSCL